MSFSATGVPKPLQSRVKKNPFLKRSSSSPFGNHPRRKPTPTQPGIKRAFSENDNNGPEERLDDTGVVTTLPPAQIPQDVVSLIKYIQQHMWSEIPERAAGMNSTRIAEVLNFRKNLPPVVTIAHLNAVSSSTTATERELARLVQSGVVRKINVVGRGKGGAAIGEGVILTEDWIRLVQETNTLEQPLKDKYTALLRDNPTLYSISASTLETTEVSDLITAGFLTSSSALSSASELFTHPGVFLPGTSSLAKSGSTAPTGTLRAVGGSSAVHDSGGGGKGLNLSPRSGTKVTGDLTFSIPSTGAYLRLLSEARTHLQDLLKKSSPKYKESPRDMLRERWNGGIPTEDPASRAKRARGEWIGVLPGKTKKWKSFYGMHFQWILEECLGSGSVECFQTGSVGLGIRGA